MLFFARGAGDIHLPSCRNNCKSTKRGFLASYADCPDAYDFEDGDVPGCGYKTVENVAGVRACGTLCDGDDDCCSFQYSPSQQTCCLHEACEPDAGTSQFQDYRLCSKGEVHHGSLLGEPILGKNWFQD